MDQTKCPPAAAGIFCLGHGMREKTKTRFPGRGKRGIAHERGGWVAADF